MDLLALKNELINDPAALGYATFVSAGNHTMLTQMLNEIRGTITIPVGVVESYRVINAIDKAEFTALTADNKEWLRLVITAPMVDLSGGEVRTGLAGLFSAGTESRAALLLLADRNGSRAEQLGLVPIGGTVSEDEVVAALRS